VDKLPERWRAGVRVHRRIDALTDAHPEARRSAARLRPAAGRWSGVAVDLLYDHVVASEWSRLAPEHGVSESLPDFAARVYRTLAAHELDLPPLARQVRRVMTAEDWLSSYADLDAVNRALERMERRVLARRSAQGRPPRPVSLAVAVEVFRKVPGTFRDEAEAVVRGVAGDLKRRPSP
jgi:acyl carrier protein phosphodiesterase